MFSTFRVIAEDTMMISTAFIILFISSCYCAVDFNERPRNFSVELLYYTQAETDGHVVISPFGIWSLMTGVAIGASGSSYNQLARAFILPKNNNALLEGYHGLTRVVLEPPSSSGVSLTSKNFLFLDDDFTVYQEFKNQLQNNFGASIKVLDFQDPNSARIANTYIEKSGARVTNVLRSDDFLQSRMILTNVISFKGLWAYPFNTSDTLIEPFYDENNVVIGNVNMMYQRGAFPFANIKELKSYVLELPYGDNKKYSMLIILPYPGTKVRDMYRRLGDYTLKNVTERLKSDEERYDLGEVDIKLPRFKISTNVVLNKPLNYMGVYDIFQPDLANFKRVSQESIFVSAIIHKAEIEVTETGTVASASAAAIFGDKMSPPSFHCKRPFLYFILEKSTTTVIFSGIYSKPTVF